jgi:hypothetical protein
MTMYETHYRRPKSLNDAAKMFADASDARYLAGGMKRRDALRPDATMLRCGERRWVPLLFILSRFTHLDRGFVGQPVFRDEGEAHSPSGVGREHSTEITEAEFLVIYVDDQLPTFTVFDMAAEHLSPWNPLIAAFDVFDLEILCRREHLRAIADDVLPELQARFRRGWDQPPLQARRSSRRLIASPAPRTTIDRSVLVKKDQRGHVSVAGPLYQQCMNAGFPLGQDIDRIAQLAAALRELDADLPLAEALEAQVSILKRGPRAVRRATLVPKLLVF